MSSKGNSNQIELERNSLVDVAPETSSQPLSPNHKVVVQTIEAALQAAEFYDLQAFTSHLTPGFYIYDGVNR